MRLTGVRTCISALTIVTIFVPLDAKSLDLVVVRAQAALASDQAKADELLFAEALYKINDKTDTTLEYIVARLRNARTPQQVSRTFADAVNDRAEPVFGRDEIVGLVKWRFRGLGPEASRLVDGMDASTRSLESGGRTPVRLSNVPRDMAIAALSGGLARLPPDARKQVARELATYLGRNHEDIVRQVREHRILKGTASSNDEQRASGTKQIDQRIYDDLLAGVSNTLSTAESSIGVSDAADDASRVAEVEKDYARAQGIVFISSVVLGPIVGPREALKLLSSRQYRRQKERERMNGQVEASAAVLRVAPQSSRAVFRLVAAAFWRCPSV